MYNNCYSLARVWAACDQILHISFKLAPSSLYNDDTFH